VAFLDGWRFCPRCGASVDHGAGHVACRECGHVVWANSVPGVEALIERDGRVLLARRANEPRAGDWDLPGGFPDEGEEPVAALRREVREETGLELAHVELLGIWIEPDYLGRSVFSVTYLASAPAGNEQAADDVAELRWVAHDDLPADEAFAFVHTPHVLRLWLARQQHA
jgi:ADP-ribose pyrophosphatase YjhB (NUDIX family)